eukprot:Skav218684  [mRNA]  locus=scaffold3220:63162:66278:- [translate_table: standard]
MHDSNLETFSVDAEALVENPRQVAAIFRRDGLVKHALTLLLQRVQGVLESVRPSWQLTELAAMCTFPEDPGQPVHADTSHVYDQQVVTIFVALHDIPPERGPTKMYPRSDDGQQTSSLRHCQYIRLAPSSTSEATESEDVLAMSLTVQGVSSFRGHDKASLHLPRHRFLFYSSWMPPARRHSDLEQIDDAKAWSVRWLVGPWMTMDYL